MSTGSASGYAEDVTIKLCEGFTRRTGPAFITDTESSGIDDVIIRVSDHLASLIQDPVLMLKID